MRNVDAIENSLRLHKKFAKCPVIKASKGEIIHRTDVEPRFFMIKSGYVKRYLVRNDGTLSIQGIYGPTYIFSLTSLYRFLMGQKLYSGPEVFYYETMTAVKLHQISQDMLKQTMEADPALYRDLFAISGRRLRSHIQEAENISLKHAEARVAHQLWCFAREFGIQKRKGVEIPVPLTHETLAAVLDLARETVSQSVSKLREKKLIKTFKNIVVLDMEALAETAYS